MTGSSGAGGSVSLSRGAWSGSPAAYRITGVREPAVGDTARDARRSATLRHPRGSARRARTGSGFAPSSTEVDLPVSLFALWLPVVLGPPTVAPGGGIRVISAGGRVRPLTDARIEPTPGWWEGVAGPSRSPRLIGSRHDGRPCAFPRPGLSSCSCEQAARRRRSTVNDLDQESASIVVLGRFNPSIFSPGWLRLHNLIGASEAERAQVQVIVPPAAVFATDWLNVDVREDRLMLATAMPQDFERLRDVAVGILGVLKETPVVALGINREIHWRVPSPEEYHGFGDMLAPKEVWEEELKLPGTQGLTIQGIRPDLWAGFIRVMIQPSAVATPLGVYAQFNDHFYLTRVEKQPESRTEPLAGDIDALAPSNENIPLAMEILRDEWVSRSAHAEHLLTRLVQLSRKGDR